tara:strand:+ start:724 stop:930 length:207 start_codon:yes stop_codon:yes gene_type:complete
MINLEKHKVYVKSHDMDMVPYIVAIKAIKEAVANIQNENEVLDKLDKAIAVLSEEIANVDNNIDLKDD